MNNHFKCIGIVGHPRHPTALTTHEMLYRWLCTKGYEVIVEQQIAHELQLKNVKTGTLAEIGQLADECNRRPETGQGRYRPRGDGPVERIAFRRARGAIGRRN